MTVPVAMTCAWRACVATIVSSRVVQGAECFIFLSRRISEYTAPHMRFGSTADDCKALCAPMTQEDLTRDILSLVRRSTDILYKKYFMCFSS